MIGQLVFKFLLFLRGPNLVLLNSLRVVRGRRVRSAHQWRKSDRESAYRPVLWGAPRQEPASEATVVTIFA